LFRRGLADPATGARSPAFKKRRRYIGRVLLLLIARNVHYRFNVRDPNELLILEIFENAAQRRRAVGRPDHKRMDAYRDNRGVTLGMSLSLAGQFGHIVDP